MGAEILRELLKVQSSILVGVPVLHDLEPTKKRRWNKRHTRGKALRRARKSTIPPINEHKQVISAELVSRQPVKPVWSSRKVKILVLLV